jgi:carboxypeptidase Taq
LRANVHGKGSLLSARELLTEATGRPLDAEAFEAHLRRRYLAEPEALSNAYPRVDQ